MDRMAVNETAYPDGSVGQSAPNAESEPERVENAQSGCSKSDIDQRSVRHYHNNVRR